jgi:hypothetical protein
MMSEGGDVVRWVAGECSVMYVCMYVYVCVCVRVCVCVCMYVMSEGSDVMSEGIFVQ